MAEKTAEGDKRDCPHGGDGSGPTGAPGSGGASEPKGAPDGDGAPRPKGSSNGGAWGRLKGRLSSRLKRAPRRERGGRAAGGGPGGEASPGGRGGGRRLGVMAALEARMLKELAWSLLALAALVVLFFIAREICYQTVWHYDDFGYPLLHFINRYALVLFTLLALDMVLAVLWRGRRRAVGYLDDVAAAAERLAEGGPAGGPIRLPDELADIEARLNAARDRSELAAARADLEAKRKSDLLVYLAHDLKTPLTSVIGYLQLLHDEPGASEQTRARYEGIALEKALRLEDLVNEFFEAARLELTESALVRGDVNLTRLVEQELSESQPAMDAKGLSYTLSADPDVTVSCDAGKIERVLANLVGNAVSYSRRGTVVEVSLRREARGGRAGAFLSMTNCGDTIAPEQLERLFEQFYRLSSSRDSGTGGAGLGLAIAKKIVEAHSGQIEAVSSEGAVTFEVWLPERPAKS